MPALASTLLRTPFHDFHQQHGAKFVEFAGWEMPLHYGSILDEHRQVRDSGGLFDVSHMGRIKFTGRHARRFLERVLTRRISDMGEKRCRYSLICNEAGGVLDDVLVYHFADHWLLVVNASNREKLLAHFERVRASDDQGPGGAGEGGEAGGYAVRIEDQTRSTAMVAVQGPRVMEMIGNFSSEVPTLKRFAFTVKNLMILKMTVSRTGYTGEDGVEVMLPASMANMAVKLLLKDKAESSVIQPAGLGARDTLRIEAGLPLYGHELDEQTNPFAAGLGFAVGLDKAAPATDEGPEVPAFIGQEALAKVRAQGPDKTLVGLRFDGRRTPREGGGVFVGDRQVGAVTSGCLSPTLGHPIAMAYAEPGACEAGEAVSVAVGSSRTDARVVKLPFYKRDSGT